MSASKKKNQTKQPLHEEKEMTPQVTKSVTPEEISIDTLIPMKKLLKPLFFFLFIGSVLVNQMILISIGTIFYQHELRLYLIQIINH